MNKTKWNSLTVAKLMLKIFWPHSIIIIAIIWLANQRYSFFHFAGTESNEICLLKFTYLKQLLLYILVHFSCRGPLTDHGVTRQMTENDGTGTMAEAISIPACIPSMFDMKICYSPGCDSLEDSPWYV